MARIDPEDEWYHLGQLGTAVLAAHPDFDTRTYGKGKLSELIKAMRQFQKKEMGIIFW